MEFVRKKINLRDFTDKFCENGYCLPNTNFPYDLDISSHWGNLPFIITLSGITTSGMPCYTTNDNKIGVKYGTLCNYYSWIRKFIMESKYYMFKNRNGGIMWQEIGANFNFKGSGSDEVGKFDLFAISADVFGELSDEIAEGYSCEQEVVFCINENADLFHEQYVSIDYAVNYINFFESYIKNGNYSGYTLDPFVDFNLFIDSDIDDMGPLKECGQDTGQVTSEHVEISGYTESKLNTLARQKSCADDDGNELDFIFNLQTLKCELKYSAETLCNGVYDEATGTYTYDKVIDITLSDDSIVYNSLTNDDVGKKGTVSFRYSIGNMVLSIDGNYETNGVIYEESHDFEVKTKTFTVGGHSYLRPYIDIDYYSGERPENADDSKIYAYVNYDYDFSDIRGNFIRDDSINGVDDITFSNGVVDIDRGHAAAYEAFNVLGEVNSLDDVEKYHDDWFRIKGKND